ncbi:MAG: crotonobetainyl-CoA:carnitine CoA-transferase CaiB-like acyl-CoA transferase [Acidimicrobiales bacterium]|jgi:crotonobetainyl-CoA:carnitine CoA-transferase CaiB-like acyl-CoA transferase
MSNALRGIRVLDLANRSAALAGRILADLGAEVVLVEPPDGNSIRALEPKLTGVDDPEASCAHQYLNANKRSVVLDLEQQQEAFLALVASADVVLDTEAPDRLADIGLSHDVLRTINPSLIQCSVTPFGLNAEWKDWKANDLVAGAAGGLVWLSGESRGKPLQGGAHPSYAMAGLTAVSAISMALHQRDHSGAGSGCHIDVSLQEATVMAVMQSATPSQWTWHDRLPRRPGLSNALRCADGGYVGLLVRPDKFDGFLAWADRVGIDHGMTIDDWEWSRLDAPRKDNPVAACTLALAAALSRDDFAAGALEADIVCLPVLGFEDLERYEQYIVNEQFLTVQHDALGRQLGFVRSPADAMADGVEIGRAPLLGEHQRLLDGLEPTSALPSKVPTATSLDPSQALAGLRVVDFGWVLAAPIGTRLLASFGAEVIRVESSAKPDSMRSQPGPDGTPDADLGGLFNTVNAGKKSLAIDLTTEDGLALIKDLIATADVVVNNFRPGAMERMGLGYEVLRGIKDDIVLLNLPGAHRFGPWAVRSSMGNILMAASGFNMLMGFEGERPRGVGVAYPDFTSPHLLTATILAALRHREATGDGQELHLTQLSGMVSLLGIEWMHYKDTGTQPPRSANRDANYCPHGVFQTQSSDHSDDEWLAIAVGNEAEWTSLCRVIGRDDLATDTRFASHAGRKVNEDALDAIIEGWTGTSDKWSLAERCQAAGVPAAPVEHLVDTYERDPQLRHHYQTVHQPSRPQIDIPIDREAAQWVGADHRITRSPGLGEHNEHVVRELLGRSEEEYVQLLLDDVLG